MVRKSKRKAAKVVGSKSRPSKKLKSKDSVKKMHDSRKELAFSNKDLSMFTKFLRMREMMPSASADVLARASAPPLDPPLSPLDLHMSPLHPEEDIGESSEDSEPEALRRKGMWEATCTFFCVFTVYSEAYLCIAAMVPLRGFQEHQHHARSKDDRGYNSRLKNFIDTVMRFAISKHASPGLTWSHQPKEGKREVFRHLAKKIPYGYGYGYRDRN